MPELPEVETVMRGLKPVLEGRRIAGVTLRRAGLRFPFPPRFSERLAGSRVTGLWRRAKYILAGLDSGEVLLVHLGMTGRFTVLQGQQARSLGEFYFESATGEAGHGPHDHVVLALDDGTHVVYTDPRRFGIMDLFPEAEAGSHKLLSGIGVEPLGNEFNVGYLAACFRGKAAPLKAALLDQRIIAGLGNIYVCEALFRARLSPRRKARTLARKKGHDPRLDALMRHVREVLAEAIAAGGSTLQDFAHTDGAAGAFQQRFLVYGREGEPCMNCGAPVKRLVQSGRSTFYCRHCQT
ncbi:bifunctional DNA-formamidopyrimidine glycosylase/DNA-(apurinic or apyrimidinic site) lyase [Aestuariivirga sp.]|uniref:bifunctional DNA-formamidopyrimidine glycosylase/DNA-(apurinic or apyrimidinic site) lyase n=1 Tax=Aestuariivirga sp. TaxID=2650926 RepID=UPI0025C5AF9B|nr:bifunctional DNA-formamidopyrimidine glycosylase/DNA-(apurinic or apyrimidinic site) lyase [Aestuariivirga sp.]MCA3554362.1 bifunctional DNA-formamidopyrimidine glycosylase/DNA-(apurinic or apyrimidinic site) lyase [Aestuariivirga sp.]